MRMRRGPWRASLAGLVAIRTAAFVLRLHGWPVVYKNVFVFYVHVPY